MKRVEWILRVGIFLTFIGHGSFAWQVRPSWLVYLTTVGFSVDQARLLMPMIGALDFLVAFTVLLRPLRLVLVWAVIWTFSTALIRPLAGLPLWDFVERGANWAAPLALLMLRGWPKSARELFK